MLAELLAQDVEFLGDLYNLTFRYLQISVHLDGLRRVRAALEAGQVDEARAFLLVNLIATYLPLSDDARYPG